MIRRLGRAAICRPPTSPAAPSTRRRARCATDEKDRSMSSLGWRPALEGTRVEPCVSSALGFRATACYGLVITLNGKLVMKLTIVVHEAEEGGYWAEVPALTGCVSQGESLDELLENVREAVEGCLSVDALDVPVSETDRVMEIAV